MLKILNKILARCEQILSCELRCIGCGCRWNQSLCPECSASLPNWSKFKLCRGCGLPRQPGQLSCSHCYTQKFAFQRIYAAFPYSGWLTQVLHRLKYDYQLEYAGVLSQLLYKYLLTQFNQWPDLIVPVPLHPVKYCQRGFNQSQELLCAFMSVKHLIAPAIAYRCKNTPSQAQLDHQQRQHNLAHAFRIRQPLTGLNIALVDDVVTSGATVNSLAISCLAAGARQVEVWSLFRTLP